MEVIGKEMWIVLFYCKNLGVVVNVVLVEKFF